MLKYAILYFKLTETTQHNIDNFYRYLVALDMDNRDPEREGLKTHEDRFFRYGPRHSPAAEASGLCQITVIATNVLVSFPRGSVLSTSKPCFPLSLKTLFHVTPAFTRSLRRAASALRF